MPRWITSPLLQQPYIIDLISSQHVSGPALDIINTVSDSSVKLIVTLLQIVDYTISYELTCLLARNGLCFCYLALDP